MSYPIAQGKAIIKSDDKTIEIKPDELTWETEVEDSDRPMGTELCHTGTYEMEDFDIVWTVYEYPLGSVNATAIEASGCHLLQNFSAFYLDDPTDGTYEDNSDPDNYFRNNL